MTTTETTEKAPAGADDAVDVNGEERRQETLVPRQRRRRTNKDDDQKVAKKDRIVPRMKLERLEELLSSKPVR